ncbi:MAG TPA: efflux transporter outer membrane subunit [Sphingomonas sp.]
MFHPARPLIVILPLLALAGCDLAPRYQRPALAAPSSFPQGGAYPALADGAGGVAAIGWKDFFTDDRLRQLIALALADNRDLRVAAANVLQARAQYRAARADLLPTITAGGGAAGSGGDRGATSHSYSADLGVSAFEVDLFGRVRNLAKAAQDQYFATRQARDSTHIALIAEIATAWATMASDQDQLRVSRQTYVSFQQSVEITRAQFEKGIASELDVRQAQTNLEDARYNVAQLRTQVTQDQNALNLLAGATVPEALLPAALGTADVTLAALPAGLDSAVLLKRPDVVGAEDQLKAQNANIGAARAAFFPTISLTAAAGSASSALGGLFGGGGWSWSGSGSVTQTLFDFGHNRANLHYAEASRDAAVATYEKAVQTAFREVSDALAERGTIDEQLAAREARATAAAAAAKLSEARYRNGIDSFLTTLDSQRTLYTAQQSLVTTRLARVTNLVELYRALGGGLA